MHAWEYSSWWTFNLFIVICCPLSTIDNNKTSAIEFRTDRTFERGQCQEDDGQKLKLRMCVFTLFHSMVVFLSMALRLQRPNWGAIAEEIAVSCRVKAVALVFGKQFVPTAFLGAFWEFLSDTETVTGLLGSATSVASGKISRKNRLFLDGLGTT